MNIKVFILKTFSMTDILSSKIESSIYNKNKLKVGI